MLFFVLWLVVLFLELAKVFCLLLAHVRNVVDIFIFLHNKNNKEKEKKVITVCFPLPMIVVILLLFLLYMSFSILPSIPFFFVIISSLA